MRLDDEAGLRQQREFELRLDRLQRGTGQTGGSSIVDTSLVRGHISKPITPRPEAVARTEEPLEYDSDAVQHRVSQSQRARYRGTLALLSAHIQEQTTKQQNQPRPVEL